MPISEAMIPELDHEAGLTRKVLERLPADKWDWTPHPKSMSIRQLASHIATIPHWGAVTLATESFDINPPGGPDFTPPEYDTPAEALAGFSRSADEFRAALAGASDEAMKAPWSLLKGGQTVFTQPRVGVLRGLIIKHIVHHRAQLALYLRLLDLPVPSIYGPSADEQN
jgi:uncharacterized damage-inducible protein DinB